MTTRTIHSMQCVEITGAGGPEVLRCVTRRAPVPKPGEVLVKVAAAGVNRPDIIQRRGFYDPPPGVSDLPGLEIAGEIVQTADDVHHWRIGDEVCALVAGGGYAQYCTVPAPQLLPRPRGLTMVEAAAIPETFFTVWTNVFERGALKAGETFLVHGGGSGIGTVAIQMANLMGARVFTTAGSDEKCRACEKLGAERAINYRTEDFVSVLKDSTLGRGVDVILDMVGGEYLARNIEALALEGRHVSIAFLMGHKVELNLMPVMLKRLTLTGSTLRARTIEEKGRIAAALKQKIWPEIEAGNIKPQIFKTFPLAEAAEAHRLLESSIHVGKIVLTM